MASRVTVTPAAGETDYLLLAVWRDAATQTCTVCATTQKPCTCRPPSRVRVTDDLDGTGAVAEPSGVLLLRDRAGDVVGAVVHGVAVTSAALARNATYIATNTTLGGGLAGLPGAFAGLATSTFWAALNLLGLAARGSYYLTSAAARAALGDGETGGRGHGADAVGEASVMDRSNISAAVRPATRVSTGVQVTPDLATPRSVPVARISRLESLAMGESAARSSTPAARSVLVPSAPPAAYRGVAQPQPRPHAPPAPAAAPAPAPAAAPGHYAASGVRQFAEPSAPPAS